LVLSQGSNESLCNFIQTFSETLREIELVFSDECDWDQIHEELFGFDLPEVDDEPEMPEGELVFRGIVMSHMWRHD